MRVIFQQCLRLSFQRHSNPHCLIGFRHCQCNPLTHSIRNMNMDTRPVRYIANLCVCQTKLTRSSFQSSKSDQRPNRGTSKIDRGATQRLVTVTSSKNRSPNEFGARPRRAHKKRHHLPLSPSPPSFSI